MPLRGHIRLKSPVPEAETFLHQRTRLLYHAPSPPNEHCLNPHMHNLASMMTPSYLTLTDLHLCLCSIAAVFVVNWYTRHRDWYRRSRGCPLPPGPQPWPIVGNLFDIPSGKLPWVVYREWASTYGNIIFLRSVQTTMIVLCSTTVAFDLMEKRSAIYSDKPVSIIDEMTGWDWNVGLMPYGQRWRNIRRRVHQYFNQSAVTKYRAHHTRHVRKFLRRSIEHQGTLSPLSIHQTIASAIVDVVYGIEIQTMEDEYIHIASEAGEFLSQSRRPGALWVDFLPFIKYIPAWVPGAAAAKLGARSRPIVQKMRNMPYDSVKYSERRTESMALDLITNIDRLEDIDSKAEEEEHARDATGIAYAAAVDTIFSLLASFLCAMVMHPEIQTKAQHVLDEVVGPNRLPDFDDFDSLPFIQAIVLESTRWIPALPLGVSHRVITDDYYDGYFIPKGTVVVPNVWAMLHDADDYPDPERFNPDRFMKDGKLNPGVRDPTTLAFGFGRRICPGRYYAKNHAFLTIACILHSMIVMPALGEDGQPVDLAPQSTTGVLSYPDRLPCVLKPRSDAAEGLIKGSL